MTKTKTCKNKNVYSKKFYCFINIEEKYSLYITTYKIQRVKFDYKSKIKTLPGDLLD